MKPENSEKHIFQEAALEGLNQMCRVFRGPDEEVCRQLKEKTFFTPFDGFLPGTDSGFPAAKKDMEVVLDQFEDHLQLYEFLDEAYIRLFISSKDGIVPLYQSCYEFEDAPMMGESARNMAALLEEKGLSAADTSNEPPDHLAVELEFLFFLIRDGNGTLPIPEEAAVFSKNTMQPWVKDFEARLESAGGKDRFYLFCTRILGIMLSAIGESA